MNFTAIFCFYVLLPYFASIVSPPQEATTCYAGLEKMMKKMEDCIYGTTNDRPSGEKRNANSENHLEYKYFNQKLDHFHYTDLNKWPQRYIINDYYYQGNGIIFLHIGTDENITNCHMQNGRWIHYCKDTNALCVGIERRGYGKSLPSGDLKQRNLVYLTTEQALTDVAWFIYNFRKLETNYKLPAKLIWVVYGRSEEGALAAWARMKFPHLVHAALSLSAPLLAKSENDDYFKLIEGEMLNHEERFKTQIGKAYMEIKKLIDNREFKALGKLFNFCDKNSFEYVNVGVDNMDFMYFTFAQTVAQIMQYGNDDLADMKQKAFDIMLGETPESVKLKTPIRRFAKLIKWNVEANTDKKCLQMSFVVALSGYRVKNEHRKLDYLLSETLGNRATLYHHCFEYGQFETFEKFLGTSIRIFFYKRVCRNVFKNIFVGYYLDRGVRKINLFYGGLKIVVSRVIFVFGSDDPNRKLGIYDQPPENSVIHVLKGARHCYELDNYKSDDPENDVKREIYDQLRKWIDLP